jgi:mannose-6-phosphate isomerase-like protein (cupin superfamily)
MKNNFKLFAAISVFISVLCLGFSQAHAQCQCVEDVKQVEQEGILPGGCTRPAAGRVVSHSELKTYLFSGNLIQGIATGDMGCGKFEVWRSSLSVGGATPKHVHETEEIFIFLKGKGRAVIGGDEFYFEAPCTVICPANVTHQLFNAGDEPTDSILVLGIDSRIFDANGNEMKLPWRNYIPHCQK